MSDTQHRIAPSLKSARARQVLDQLLIGGGRESMLMVLALLIGLGWFTDSLFEWVADVGTWIEGGAVEDWVPVHRVVAVCFFAAVVYRLRMLAEAARERFRPQVETIGAPPRARALILYLSNLKAEVFDGLATASASFDGVESFRKYAEREDIRRSMPWRMPIEAIAHHRTHLSRIVLICSQDEPDGPGSASQRPLFEQLVRRCFPGHAFTIECAEGGAQGDDPGVGFNDINALVRLTDIAFERLVEEARVAPADILIDITSGSKLCSVAGAVVALAEGRRVQYVNGQYQVQVQDVSYVLDDGDH
ncbi:hypothetical protein [Marichromatium bheemlicum]|uniref:CRISPR-associated protein n=1 Tax=Marichromatium bheemlicum TaxID=365339 RepID=A0ABX1IBU3_9GAMM|nr:hypothetical protein [Marichromatium bheemlicum]NKN34651.1 hypothetical protein [Marichromatium bheemlicum]